MKRWYNLLWWIIAPFFSIVHPCRLVGRENLPEYGIFCANHSCLSDPICLIVAVGHKRQMHAMAKAEFMRTPVIGWLLKKAGIFSVERGKSDVVAIKTAMRFLKNKENVLIFPEGTRIKNGVDKYGNASEAKSGAAMLAVRTGVPLVPVYIPPKKRWFGITKVVIGDPYYPEVQSKKGSAEEYQAIADDLMVRIFALEDQSE